MARAAATMRMEATNEDHGAEKEEQPDSGSWGAPKTAASHLFKGGHLLAYLSQLLFLFLLCVA